jgi:hypothetical protein
MSKMKQVAEILGLEWDDEKGQSEIFEVKGITTRKYVLKPDSGVLMIEQDGVSATNFLQAFLTGEYTIKKLPRKPKNGEMVYLLDLDYDKGWRYVDWQGYSGQWNQYNRGTLRFTESEIIELVDEVLKLTKNR